MKYYILAQSEFSLTLKEILFLIKKNGFDGVFFNLEHNKITSDEIKLCKELNLDIETLHLPYGNSTKKINLLWDDDEKAIETIEEYKEYIDFAAENGIKTVVMHASNGFKPPNPNKKGLRYFEMIADYCQRKDVILAIENIKSMEHVAYIMENLRHDNVKFCFDIGHANAFTKNLYDDIWDKLFLKLQCVHLHDNDGKQDAHLLPGMGTINWGYWKEKLEKLIPMKHFTFEFHYKDREIYYKDIDAERFYRKAMEKIKEVMEE